MSSSGLTAPEAYAQRSRPDPGSMRSMRAPSACSRRAASSTASWRTLERSAAAEIRTLIWRSVRSTSARSASSERERSRSSIRRVFAMAAAAWSASARTRAIWAWSNAFGRVENVPSRAEDPVAIDEGRGDHRSDADVGHDLVGLLRVAEGRVVAVVVGEHDGRAPGPRARTSRCRVPARDRGPSRDCAGSGCRRRGRSAGSRSTDR